jgi:hypothetical protein
LHVMSDDKKPVRTASEKRAAAYRPFDDQADMPEDQAVKILRKHLPWKDWLLADYFRYWYGLGAFVLDVFLPLQIARIYHLHTVPWVLALLLLLGVLLYLEIRLYQLLWPSGVKTRIEAEKRALRRVFRRIKEAFRRD